MGYVLGRLVCAGLSFLAVALLTFLLWRGLPGTPGPATVTAARHTASPPAAAPAAPLLGGYRDWVRRSFTLDFGPSLVDGRPARRVLLAAAERSLGYMLPALLLTYLLGVPLGLRLGLRPRTRMSRLLRPVPVCLFSLPGFVVGLLLLEAGRRLGLPTRGLEGDLSLVPASRLALLRDTLAHLLLPTLAAALLPLAYVVEQTRASVAAAVRSPWVPALKSRRLPGRWERRHLLRPALVPVVTHGVLALPALVAGSLFVERIFAIPGFGRVFLRAVAERDQPVVLAAVTVTALLTLAALLLGDLLGRALDPRIRYR